MISATVRASAAVTGNDDGWRVRVRMESGGEVSERWLSEIEANHETYTDEGRLAASPQLRALLR